ncbi:hypothetical protein F385_270 [Pantoea agglomerans 299R]|nr:hypothetical protein F385_270 [Pantoea agglomerans 299R]
MQPTGLPAECYNNNTLKRPDMCQQSHWNKKMVQSRHMKRD